MILSFVKIRANSWLRKDLRLLLLRQAADVRGAGVQERLLEFLARDEGEGCTAT